MTPASASTRELEGGDVPPGRPCPYCGAATFERWVDGVTDHLGIAKGTWTFWRCTACHSAVLHPAPMSDELGELYPDVYSFHAGVANGAGTLRKVAALVEEKLFFQLQYRSQMQSIQEAVGPVRPGARLLDIGCGVGQRLLAFRSLGYDVHGLDFLPAVVDHLRNNLRVEATCGDISRVDELFPPAAFDVVTAFQVVEHVVDPGSLIRNVFKVLRPGGWFVATVPMGDSKQAEMLGSRWACIREAPRHLNLPSQQGLQRLAKAIGFTNATMTPDSLLNCAGVWGLSVFPGAATATVYGKRSWRGAVTRALGAGAAALSLPVCAVENYLLRRPASGMWLAQKPLAP